jgi:hypothetical protein
VSDDFSPHTPGGFFLKIAALRRSVCFGME